MKPVPHKERSLLAVSYTHLIWCWILQNGFRKEVLEPLVIMNCVRNFQGEDSR